MKNPKVCVVVSLFGALPFMAICQASSCSDFELKVTFAKDIQIEDMEVSYFLKSGNHFDEVSWRTDCTNNSITVYGRNSYVLWVAFPTLIFSSLNKIGDFKTTEKRSYHTFYLASEGPLSSYTGIQTKEIKFERNNAVITCSLEKHNHDFTHSDVKIDVMNTYQGDSFNLNVSNEIIKIEKQ